MVITETLLQQTRAEAVEARREQFFSTYSSWAAIRAAPVGEIEAALMPFGLWRRRASSLKKLSMALASTSDKLPQRRKDLEALPGVGQYIANAVELMIFERPLPLLDVNMSRVLERLFTVRTKADIRYDPPLQLAARRLIGRKYAKEVNFACLDLAALVCLPRNPKCGACPVSEYCNFFKNTQTLDNTAS